jgi:hypothetical protein
MTDRTKRGATISVQGLLGKKPGATTFESSWGDTIVVEDVDKLMDFFEWLLRQRPQLGHSVTDHDIRAYMKTCGVSYRTTLDEASQSIDNDTVGD